MISANRGEPVHDTADEATDSVRDYLRAIGQHRLLDHSDEGGARSRHRGVVASQAAARRRDGSDRNGAVNRASSPVYLRGVGVSRLDSEADDGRDRRGASGAYPDRPHRSSRIRRLLRRPLEVDLKDVFTDTPERPIKAVQEAVSNVAGLARLLPDPIVDDVVRWAEDTGAHAPGRVVTRLASYGPGDRALVGEDRAGRPEGCRAAHELQPSTRSQRRQAVSRARAPSPGPRPGGKPGTYAGSPEVRPAPGLQVQHLCHLVDTTGREQGARRPRGGLSGFPCISWSVCTSWGTRSES